MNRLFVLPLALALVAPLASAQPGGGAGQGQRPARGERTLWWNAPELVESLSLSATQREKMDAAWTRHEAALRERTQAGDGRNAYQEALEAGRWDDARAALAKLADGARVPVQANGELKIAVLELLSEQQRTKLVSDHPMLMRQVWSPRPHWAQRKRRQAGAGGAREPR